MQVGDLSVIKGLEYVLTLGIFLAFTVLLYEYIFRISHHRWRERTRPPCYAILAMCCADFGGCTSTCYTTCYDSIAQSTQIPVKG